MIIFKFFTLSEIIFKRFYKNKKIFKILPAFRSNSTEETTWWWKSKWWKIFIFIYFLLLNYPLDWYRQAFFYAVLNVTKSTCTWLYNVIWAVQTANNRCFHRPMACLTSEHVCQPLSLVLALNTWAEKIFK